MDPFGIALSILLGLLIGSFAISIFLVTTLGMFDRMRICRWTAWIHQWSTWGEPYSGTQTRETGHFGDVRSYPVVVQSRVCKRCGAVDHRIENADVKIADLLRASERSRPHGE